MMDFKAHTCPTCLIKLGVMIVGFHQTTTCEVCNGIFLSFEQLENQFQHNARTFELAPVIQRKAGKCPVDGHHLQSKKIFDRNSSVTVKQCSHCNGVWFEKGGIQQANMILRKQHRRLAKQNNAARIIDNARYKAEHYDTAPAISSPMWWFSVLTYFPVEGCNQVFRRPLVNSALIVLCLLVFTGQFIEPQYLFPYFALSKNTVVQNPIELITSMFMHGGILHIMGNLYFLKLFGDNVEDRLGRTLYAVFFLFSGCFAGICYVVFGKPGLPMIGASGAISGVLAAYLLFFPKVKVFILPNIYDKFRLIPVNISVYVPIWISLQIVMSLLYTNTPIAWSAHIGGFVGGYALAFFLKMLVPDARLEFLQRQEIRV